MNITKDRRLFQKLYLDQTGTELWKELKAYDVFVYTELLSKRVQGKFNNPDTYILTPSMMEGRISKPRFYKSIGNLMRRGFVEISEHGGIGTEGLRRANIYVLSTKWQGVMEKRKQTPSYLLPRLRSPHYKLSQKV